MSKVSSCIPKISTCLFLCFKNIFKNNYFFLFFFYFKLIFLDVFKSYIDIKNNFLKKLYYFNIFLS